MRPSHPSSSLPRPTRLPSSLLKSAAQSIDYDDFHEDLLANKNPLANHNPFANHNPRASDRWFEDDEENLVTQKSVPYFLKTRINDSVQTPHHLYADLDAEFHFTDDPCPLNPNPRVDGLKRTWGSSTFVNPPFSDIVPWVIKAIEEMQRGKVIVLLITARVSSKYWFEFVFPFASEIRFLEGKVKFEGHLGTGLPQPIALVIFDGRKSPPPRQLGEAGGYRYYRV
jgi:hypothetical protein